MTSSVLSEMDRHTDTFSFPGDSRDIFNFKGMHRSMNSLNGQVITIFIQVDCFSRITVLPAKSDSDVMFCLQSYR